jgi:biotin carboxylase
MAKIAFVGYRKKAVQAAVALGYEPVIWCPESPVSHAYPTIAAPFPEIDGALSADVDSFFKAQSVAFDAIIPLTERSIPAAMLLMQAFDKPLPSQRMAACHDKWLMKQQAEVHQIPVAPYALLDQAGAWPLISSWDCPVYAKLRNHSGGRGLQVASSLDALKKLQGHGYLVEKAIHGVEMSMEIFFQKRQLLFLNSTQYYLHYEINVVPAPDEFIQKKTLERFARHIMEAFELDDGIAHIEFFVTEDGLVFNELTIRPPGGFIMDLIQRSYRFDPWKVLLQLYLKQKVDVCHRAESFSAAYLIHPGPGKIAQISDIETLRALPSVKEVYLKKTAGDIVSVRVGSGQDIGHVFFQNQAYVQLLADIEWFREHFKISHDRL